MIKTLKILTVALMLIFLLSIVSNSLSFGQTDEITLESSYYEKMDSIINPESKPKPILKLNDDKFTITKKTCLWCQYDSFYTDTISIANLGDKDAQIKLQILKLKQISSATISNAPKEFTPQMNFTRPDIRAGNVDNQISLKIPIPFDSTSSYSGKVWFSGEDIEPFSTDIEVDVLPDTNAVIVYVSIGLVGGFIFGVIEYWRSLKKTTPPKSYVLSGTIFDKKTEEEQKLLATIKESKGGMITKDLIDEIDLALSKWIRPKNWIFDTKKRNYVLSRIILIGLAIVTSFPIVIYGNAYFSGIPIVDAFLAISIGFLSYRGQDLKKIYRGDKSLG